MFMDHVLHPTLTNSSFHTEVHYLGAEKDMGVVYCEMAGREHSEADMMDLSLRKLLLPDSSYSFEHGGLSQDIAQLTNEEIKKYHAKYYNWNNIAVVVSGNVVVDKVVDTVEKILLEEQQRLSLSNPSVHELPLSHSERESCSKLTFPSTDMEYGSIGLAWKGPRPSDYRKFLSLGILFRYLKETSASPLAQRFVEIEDPIANDVEIDLKGLAVGATFMIFSGVPISDSGDDQSDDDLEYDSDSFEEDMDLFQEGVVKGLVLDLFNELVENNLCLKTAPQENVMSNIIARHKIKLLETLEDDAHEAVNYCCIVDLLQHRYHGSANPLGSFLNVFSLFDELEKEPITYWISLLKEYILEQPCQQVLLLPDVDKLVEIEKERKQNYLDRLSKSGKDQEMLAQELQSAMKDNKPESCSDWKSSSSAPTTTSFPFNAKVDEFSHPQFRQIHRVSVKTNFFHFLIAIDISNVSSDLKKYLVLFQELYFNSPVSNFLSQDNVCSYQDVVKHLSSRLCSYDASVGFGNDTFSCSYLANYFIISANCLPSHFEDLIFIIHSIFAGILFVKERLVVAKNLSSQLKESKRDSSDVLDSIVTILSRKSVMGSNGKKSKNIENIEKIISMFVQEEFLDGISDRFNDENDSCDDVLNDLNSLKREILQSKGFLHVAAPIEFEMKSFDQKFLEIWSPKQQKLDHHLSLPSSPSPIIFNDEMPKLFYTLSSATSSNLTVQISCPLHDLLLNNIQEYVSILLVCQLLSRTEGPLYSLIRGEGLAYHASMYTSLWSGLICFDIGESVNLAASFCKFYHLMLQLIHEVQNNLESNVFDTKSLEMAKSATYFQFAEEHSSAPLTISYALKSALKGFFQDELYLATLERISLEDVRSAFLTYFSAFVDSSKVMAIAVQHETEKSVIELPIFNLNAVSEEWLISHA